MKISPCFRSSLLTMLIIFVSCGLHAGERARTFYGVNEDPRWNFATNELPQFVAMLRQTGCGSIRIGIRWREIEPRKGEWDFSALDAIVDMIPKDIEILAVLGSVPQWANGVDPKKDEGWFDAYPPKDLADWKKYVAQTVARYSKRIKHWEIWNEENGVGFYRPHPDAKAYTELLKAAYLAAKKTDPECVVVLGGLVMNGIIPNPFGKVKIRDYLEDLYKAGARPYFDVCNIHPYVLPHEGADYMMKLTRDTLSLMSQYGDGEKVLWITEVGCGGGSMKAEKEQAQLLSDTYEAAAKEPRVQKVFWFLLRDMEKDLVGPESSMGLFARQGKAKPALQAFVRATKAVHSTQQSPAGDDLMAAPEE